MRHYLGRRSESGAVVFLRELPGTRPHEEIGRKRQAEPGRLGNTPHVCGVRKYAAARAAALRRAI